MPSLIELGLFHSIRHKSSGGDWVVYTRYSDNSVSSDYFDSKAKALRFFSKLEKASPQKVKENYERQ